MMTLQTGLMSLQFNDPSIMDFVTRTSSIWFELRAGAGHAEIDNIYPGRSFFRSAEDLLSAVSQGIKLQK